MSIVTCIYRSILLAACTAILLGGCASRTPAPVIERGAQPPRATSTAGKGEYHTVRKGDTLYSIALEHGQSYQDVAAWNHIDNPNLIRIGQQLRIAPAEGVAVAKPIASPSMVETRPLAATGVSNTDMLKREPKGGKQPYTEQAMAMAQKPATVDAPQPAVSAGPESVTATPAAGGGSNWTWPSAGNVMAPYVEGSSKGIDIEGRIGDPVLAAQAGKVTYAGSGIRGYGNLLIIQHADSLSSVYAHNSKLLAKEGQQVAKGQKIAELGDSDTDRPRLHFEIRRQGKPLDPATLLPQR